MLGKRLISGSLFLFAVVLVGYVLPAPCGVLFLMALTLAAQHECYGMMTAIGVDTFRGTGYAGGVAILAAAFWGLGLVPNRGAADADIVSMVMAAVVLAVFLRQILQKQKKQPMLAMAGTLFGILYGGFLLHFMLRLAFTWHTGNGLGPVEPTGRILLLYLVLVVKSSDVGAYFTGRFLGRHKMAPVLSPNKTWEGCVGGVLFSLLVSVVFRWIAGGTFGSLVCGWGDAVVLGLLLPVTAIIGDLFESMLKRASGVKDSGRFIPGMGGILDVLDSLLFGSPVLYAYVVLFL